MKTRDLSEALALIIDSNQYSGTKVAPSEFVGVREEVLRGKRIKLANQFWALCGKIRSLLHISKMYVTLSSNPSPTIPDCHASLYVIMYLKDLSGCWKLETVPEEPAVQIQSAYERV